ncbi:MAG TPA: hypothetical protein VK171_07080 [Fimbriimonas sp.]|nr:hypothetical protein [Fimbriimonas sp.]
MVLGYNTGVEVDDDGNLHVGDLVIPEKLVHAPWVEMVKIGASARKTGLGSLGVFGENMPGNEHFKIARSVLNGLQTDEPMDDAFYGTLGQGIPSGLIDYHKARAKIRKKVIEDRKTLRYIE